MNDEPQITINGIVLTHAQCKVVRQAIEHFNTHLSMGDCVEQECGITLMFEYRDRTKEIQAIMYAP